MYTHNTKIRVRYSETDQMGFVYYGHYFTYYEVARVESLRALGYSYRQLEDAGYLLPVLENHIHYIQPAKYDDLLTVKIAIPKPPSVRLFFDYEIFNPKGELINKATTVLVFLDKKTNRPARPPRFFLELFEGYFD